MKPLIALIAMVLFFASPAFSQWIDGQPAQYVIGQPDFVSWQYQRTATGLNGPEGVAVDVEHGKIYVADPSNDRVLRYAYPITANQPTAEVVFGQADFVSDTVESFYNHHGYTPDPTASQLLQPWSLAVDHGDLWVCDIGNSRLLKFASAYSISANYPNADGVLGQSDFLTRGYACTGNSFSPRDICFDASRSLWVVDGYDRVLRFDSAYTRPNGSYADGVLGQPDFTTSTVPASPSATVMSNPRGVYAEGTTLWVCDGDFNRVLRFDNAAAKPNGAPADGVLGQSTMTDGGSAMEPAKFNLPYAVCVDGAGTAYVADQGNIRIMIFKTAAQKPDGANADNLLGATDFYHAYYHLDSLGFGGPSSIRQIEVDPLNGKLLVVDRSNSRVLVFAAPGPLAVGKQPVLPSRAELFENYPNPFNPTTNIRYQVSGVSNVKLVVYDILGREVAVLVNERQAPGNYEVRFDATGLASGVYLYRLTARQFVKARRMILLK